MVDKAIEEFVSSWQGVWQGQRAAKCSRCACPIHQGDAIRASRLPNLRGGAVRTMFFHLHCHSGRY